MDTTGGEVSENSLVGGSTPTCSSTGCGTPGPQFSRQKVIDGINR